MATDLKTLAAHQGLSISATGSALLKQSLIDTVTKRHAALLEPIIEHAISRRQSPMTKLLVKLQLDLVQVRQLAVNILARQEPMLKMDEPRLIHLRESAKRQSKQELRSALTALDAPTRAALLSWLTDTTPTSTPPAGEDA